MEKTNNVMTVHGVSNIHLCNGCDVRSTVNTYEKQ